MLWLRNIIVFFVYLSVTISLNNGLNLDEINSIHYAIDILNKPVVKDKIYKEEMMTIVNKFGQEYVCSLPKVAPSDQDVKNEENILDQLVDISGLLKPMETAPCLIKTVDWWTYEFCYGSVIKQYHLEDNKASGPILILGKYESEYNWKNSSETKNRLQRFHSQFYVNGTKCDLTGEPRRTEVRFHCEDGVGDYIQRVDEPESCRYVVTIATTRVCHHPYLRLQAVRTPHSITCSPALTEDQYNQFLTYQDKKAQEEESLKEKWLKQNAEVLGEEADHQQESQSIFKPILIDEDDELKMNIKIFKLPQLKKNKNLQSAEIKDVLEMETQGTLDEIEKVDETSENKQKPSGDSDDATIPADYKDTTDDNIDGNDIDREQIISDAQAEELDLVDKEESYLKEGDELEEEEGNEGHDGIDTLPQASKSTDKDHFSRLQQKLKQLGENFLMPEKQGIEREVENKRIAEIHHMVNNMRDGQIKNLEKEVKEWTKKMMGQDGDLEIDNEDLEDDEKIFETAFSSFMDALDKAQNKLATAKKEMEILEKLFDTQAGVGEMEFLKTYDSENPEAEKFLNTDGTDESVEAEAGESENDLDDDGEESNSHSSKVVKDSKNGGSTKQLRIIKNKVEDENQKSKLEQTIKDRLQKLGLEKISRKFELKILTPNSLEDEDNKNPPLSQEETEAFQNMIVKILSANAEELEERENHRKLEKNYGFKWDEAQLAEDEDE